MDRDIRLRLRKGSSNLFKRVVRRSKPTRPTRRIRPTRVAPKFAIGSSAGRFKRLRRSRKVSKPHYTNKDTLYGTITGTHSVYSGYSTCGGRIHALQMFSEAFLRHLLKLRKVEIKGRQDDIPWTENPSTTPRYKEIKLLYRDELGDGDIVETSATVQLWNSHHMTYYSFNELVSFISSQLADDLKKDTLYLFGFTLSTTNDGTDSEVVVQSRQLCDWQLNLNVKTMMKIQNITPADDEAGLDDNEQKYSKDSILSNPLSGRSYLFGPGFPRPRPTIVGPGTHNSSLEDLTNQTDVNGFVQFPASTDSVYASGGALHTPPSGGNVFANCKKGSSLYLSPGNFKWFTNVFTFKGTVKSFCKKASFEEAISTDTNSSPGKRFTLGETFAFGFAPTMRTTNAETVRLAYHMDRTSSCYISARHRVVVPRSNTSQLYAIGSTMSSL